MALSDLMRPRREPLTWVDGYGVRRTSREMTSEHLWNIMGYIRDRVKGTFWGYSAPALKAKMPAFYYEAARELQRRGLLP